MKTKIIQKEGYILYNARYLSGDGGTIITSDDKVFIPCSPLKNEWYPNKHQSLYKLKLPKLAKFGKVVLIDTKCSDDNYSHWLADHLPRFYWLTKMNLDLSEYTLVSSSAGNKFQNFTYKVLIEKGFIFDKVVNISINHIFCDEIVIPPYSTHALNCDDNSYDFEHRGFLEKLFLTPQMNVDLGKRIYLSRRRSLRSSPDEKDLVKQLETFGVKEVFLEDHTLSEQASILNKADLVIGYHGAGLTNIYFCRPGTTVIEIFGPDFIVTNFWGIANQLHLRYLAYCEDLDKQNIQSYRLARQARTSIDIRNFIKFLKSECLLDVSS